MDPGFLLPKTALLWVTKLRFIFNFLYKLYKRSNTQENCFLWSITRGTFCDFFSDRMGKTSCQARICKRRTLISHKALRPNIHVCVCVCEFCVWASHPNKHRDILVPLTLYYVVDKLRVRYFYLNLHTYIKIICPVCTNNELCLEHSTHCITEISTDIYCATLVFTNPK
jgi:hypothetical protein